MKFSSVFVLASVALVSQKTAMKLSVKKVQKDFSQESERERWLSGEFCS